MTSNQYKKICECCDSLLLSNETSDERVAINWLHVIREHPIYLKEYKNLLHPVGLYQKIKLYFLQDIYNIIRFIYYLTSVFFSTQKKSQISSHIPNKCDILFVPGGIYHGGFRPFVTMSQNLLPFEWHEILL